MENTELKEIMEDDIKTEIITDFILKIFKFEEMRNKETVFHAIEKRLMYLKTRGEIYEPKEGNYRLTNE